MKYSLSKTTQVLALSALMTIPMGYAAIATQEQQDIMNRFTLGFIALTHLGEGQWEEFTSMDNNMSYAWHVNEINKTFADLKNLHQEFENRKASLPQEFVILMDAIFADNLVKIEAFTRILSDYIGSKNFIGFGGALTSVKKTYGSEIAINKFHHDLMKLCLLLKSSGASSAEKLGQAIKDFINKHTARRVRTSVELLAVFARRMNC